MKKIVFALAAVAAFGLTGQSMAGTASGTILVTATSISSCLVVGGPLVFGNYDGGAATDATGAATVSLTCAGTSTANIALDNGINFNGGTRRMAFGTNMLSYGLFQPTANTPGAACGALTLPFGSGGTSLSVLGLTVISAQLFNVCGSIPRGQNAPIGAYTDLVNVTVNF